MGKFFEEHPIEAKVVVEKAFEGARSRIAARKARELTRRKSVLENSTLPGKLADCSNREPEKCEIITNYEGLKEFIKQNEDKYIFYLPFLMVDKIDKELKENNGR